MALIVGIKIKMATTKTISLKIATHKASIATMEDIKRSSPPGVRANVNFAVPRAIQHGIVRISPPTKKIRL